LPLAAGLLFFRLGANPTLMSDSTLTFLVTRRGSLNDLRRQLPGVPPGYRRIHESPKSVVLCNL
jgi:hypothetical protein